MGGDATSVTSASSASTTSAASTASASTATAATGSSSSTGPLLGIEHGESATIGGSGFGTKETPGPIIYDELEGGTDGELVRNQPALVGTWQTGAGDDAVFYTSAVAMHGSKAAHHEFRAGGAYNASLALNGSWDTAYLDFWIRVDLIDERSRNFKTWRVYDGGGEERGNDVYYCPADGDAGGCGLDPPWIYKTGSYNDGEWIHYEVIARWVDGQTVFRQYRNGVLDADEAGFSPSTPSIAEIRIGHYWGAESSGACAANSGADVYTDSIYVDSTFQRVVIGNGPTFEASTRRAVQRATAWADDSITFVANLTGLQQGDTHTVFVVGPDDQVLYSAPIDVAIQ